MKNALRDTKDIGYLAFVGHGGESVLYLGTAKGKFYNLSPWGGAAGEASDSTAITELPKENIRLDARADLFSCYSACAEPGGVSMARAFADHFGIVVQGAGAGVSFNKNGPIIRNIYRIEAYYLQIRYKRFSGAGGWQTVFPSFAMPCVQ